MDQRPFDTSKPAIESSTMRSGALEVANGLTQILGNFFGVSQVIGVVNGLASIFAGVQTIRGRAKATQRIQGVFFPPDKEDDYGN